MVYVKSIEINTNWLLNQILGSGKTNYQITKIDNSQLNIFLQTLNENPFEMPNGQLALKWLRDRVKLRYDQAQDKMSQEWENTRIRYRYILNKIDMLLMKRKNEPTENQNELTVSFEDTKDDNKNELTVSFGD